MKWCVVVVRAYGVRWMELETEMVDGMSYLIAGTRGV